MLCNHLVIVYNTCPNLTERRSEDEVETQHLRLYLYKLYKNTKISLLIVSVVKKPSALYNFFISLSISICFEIKKCNEASQKRMLATHIVWSKKGAPSWNTP